MDLQEVTRRVLLGHWIVILICVLASAGGAVAWHIGDTPTFSASTRLILDAPPPTSVAEATALADGAKAIVTSPTHIIDALHTANVTRDIVVEAHNITLVPLGTSGVLQVTVRDSEPQAAADIANGLAYGLIETRRAVSPVAQAADLDKQIKDVKDRIKLLNDHIALLNEQLANIAVNNSNFQTAAVQAQILSDRITADSNQRAELTQEELSFQSQRASLGVYSSKAAVIDLANAPTKPDPSRLPVDLGLALVIGLVVGIAVAAALESRRPMFSSGVDVAQSLGVPLLGSLPDMTGTLPERLKVAASATEVHALELIGVGDTPDLSALARSLRGPLGAGQGEGKGLSIYSIADAPVRYRNGQAPASAFVLVTPEQIRKSALAPVQELISISGRPLLGVIAHKPDRIAKSLSGSKRSPRLSVVLDADRNGVKGMSEEMRSDLWGAQ
jgi:uncharacterized protein involved in exopolysaccharide biosynthesis